MIDAAKLDEIKREIYPLGGLQLPPRIAGELVALAREALAYRALIDAHNAGCDEACDARQAGPNPGTGGLCASMRRTSKGRCPDCPRLAMIDVAGINSLVKE